MLALMKFLPACVLALMLCTAAHGTTIILTGLHSSLGMQSTLYFDEDGAATLEYWAGGIDVLVNGYSRMLFCVDLFTNIGLSTYGTVLDFSDTAQLQRVGWLLETQLAGIGTIAGGAAMQLAIWDIMTDNGDGFAAGKGRVTQSTDPLIRPIRRCGRLRLIWRLSVWGTLRRTGSCITMFRSPTEARCRR
jgi:hypothetical protein